MHQQREDRVTVKLNKIQYILTGCSVSTISSKGLVGISLFADIMSTVSTHIYSTVSFYRKLSSITPKQTNTIDKELAPG